MNEVKSLMSRLMSPPFEGVGVEKLCEAARSRMSILLLIAIFLRFWASFVAFVCFLIPIGCCCFGICFGRESLGFGNDGDSCNLSCEMPVSSSGSCMLVLFVSMVK